MGWFQTILQAVAGSDRQPLAPLQALVINNASEPESLDPHKTLGSAEQKIMGDLLEGLFIFDRHGEVVPGMALYAYSPDKKSWSFHLRPGTKWSNGDKLDAHDFVYSWRRLADPKTAAPKAELLRTMKVANIEAILAGKLPPEALGIKALGPLTLQLTLSKPLGFLKKLLVNSGLLPVHQATIERYGEQWTQPTHWVGNGAYRLKKHVVNEKIVLIRNPHYWDNQHTTIDQVTYLSLDEATEIARYQTGDIDLTHTKVSSDLLKKLKKELIQELRRFPMPAFRGYQINITLPPFNDVRVRQALNLVLDRQAILQQLCLVDQLPTHHLVPDGLGGSALDQPNWALWSPAQRLETAQALLQAAGYGPENPLKFTLLYPNSEANKQLALVVCALWQAYLGVETTLVHREWKVYLEETRLRNYQMAHLSFSTTGGDPYGLLGNQCSHSCDNETGYNNPNFDHWLEKALDCLHDTERRSLYYKAEAQLAEDVPIIPLFHPVALRLVKPYVGGLSDRNPMNRFYTKDLYLTKHPLAPKKARQ
ncbi:ABC transporter substrate-binding protein [unidentified bacterial endosymbiont]|uniref:ABC transporter substrate-binding protein n=1 Tax=unidentified bacterial endosymbiont TaxID=2355 RepID=UPI00209E7968|nr:ABC transporter substrate-binding protein [unidentified bacterial endosymbiont]